MKKFRRLIQGAIVSSFILSSALYGQASRLSASDPNYEHYISANRRVKTINLTSSEVSMGVGETRSFKLSERAVIHKLYIQAEARGQGDASGQVFVNGKLKSNFYAPRRDPSFYVDLGGVEAESIEITAQPVEGAQGRLHILDIKAVVSTLNSEPLFPHDSAPAPLDRLRVPGCYNLCDTLPFPHPYKSLIGNVSARAIYLVDRLEPHTNYKDLGEYLLPIKKSATLAMAKAESFSDAHSATRPYALDLLKKLDSSEVYINDMIERKYAYQLGSELLGLREYIRSILGPEVQGEQRPRPMPRGRR